MGRNAAWGKHAEEELPQFYCSSDDFKRFLYQSHQHLLVPEREIVYLGEGVPLWDPDREQPHPGDGPCPDAGAIHPGGRLCCPHCHLSGFESRLFDQRRLSGYPPPERERRPAPKPRPNPLPEPAPTKPASSTDPKRRRWWRDLSWSKPPSALKKRKSA